MTQQAIEVFLAIAQTGSLSKAAQLLYITQPAVSRHVRTLEEELGCSLFNRGRGRRSVDLTEEGQEFIQVAEKWRQLWQETREIAHRNRHQTLRVAAIGSVSSYLLPTVFRSFLEQYPEAALTFHNQHSPEAYQDMANGLVDLALISDDMYHAQVETIPAYREPMALVVSASSSLSEPVHPAQLDPGLELRVPWNPEYDIWHAFWFSSGAQPRAVLDQVSLLEDFFSWPGDWSDSWVIAPLSVAVALQKRTGVQIHRMCEKPPDERIYYLLGPRRKMELTRTFLHCLDQTLQQLPHVESYLTDIANRDTDSSV